MVYGLLTCSHNNAPKKNKKQKQKKTKKTTTTNHSDSTKKFSELMSSTLEFLLPTYLLRTKLYDKRDDFNFPIHDLSPGL